MLLWVVFSALTAAVVGSLLWSYRRAEAVSGDAARADVAVYADQLDQIEADRMRGLLSGEEAASARAEVGRRLLSRVPASELRRAASDETASRRQDRLVPALALLIPVLALGLYALLGSPGLPDQPHAGRTPAAAARSQVEVMIAQVERRLREAPQDGNGWDVIAPIYLRLDRFADAAEAFANANRLLGETPKRLAGFAQAEILANNGVVNPNARMAAERLLALEPGRVDARLWLALAKEQDGKLEAALAEYRSLLNAPGMTDAMRGPIEQRIGIVERLARGETVTPPAGGAAVRSETPPAPAQPPSIQDQTAQDQTAMIEGMVARLAARLAADGKDPAGWVQLMRSYMVMGRKDEAAQALLAARKALAEDAKVLDEVNGAAAGLGVETGEGRK